MSEPLILRKAVLIDEAYAHVADVALPASKPWPPAIRWKGRVFTFYAQTHALTIEEIQSMEREQSYREIEVYEVHEPSV